MASLHCGLNLEIHENSLVENIFSRYQTSWTTPNQVNKSISVCKGISTYDFIVMQRMSGGESAVNRSAEEGQGKATKAAKRVSIPVPVGSMAIP